MKRVILAVLVLASCPGCFWVQSDRTLATCRAKCEDLRGMDDPYVFCLKVCGNFGVRFTITTSTVAP